MTETREGEASVEETLVTIIDLILKDRDELIGANIETKRNDDDNPQLILTFTYDKERLVAKKQRKLAEFDEAVAKMEE